MRKNKAENLIDEDFNSEDVSDSEDEDDTNMTVAENITKSANRRAKKSNLTEEEDLGGSSFHSASKNRPKLGKSHSSTSPAAMLLSIPQTSSASLLQPLAVTPNSRGTTLDPIVLFPGHNFIRDVKAKDDTNFFAKSSRIN